MPEQPWFVHYPEGVPHELSLLPRRSWRCSPGAHSGIHAGRLSISLARPFLTTNATPSLNDSPAASRRWEFAKAIAWPSVSRILHRQLSPTSAFCGPGDRRGLQPDLHGIRAVPPASRRRGASDRGPRHDVSEDPASRSGDDHRHADHRFHDDDREVYLSTSKRPTADLRFQRSDTTLFFHDVLDGVTPVAPEEPSDRDP